jgi:drug/metabolite transporter (DMT)-like permease
MGGEEERGGGEEERGASWRGAAMALGAAALFGLSTPVAKLLLTDIDPLLLAAVLYLGCGIGLALFRFARRLLRPGFVAEAGPTRADWPWLLGAIFFGGVLGPILLLTGLSLTAAATTSLLLNLESVFTALLAWFVFRESVDRRIAFGMAAIALGALVLSWQGSGAAMAGAGGLSRGLLGPLAISGACLAWALDNNLTRRVSLLDPTLIAALKGLVAGVVNLGLALVLVPRLGGQVSMASHGSGALAVMGFSGEILIASLVGMLSYGVSLVLFVLALRDIGAARTGAYYASAPFIGAILAVGALGEPVTAQLLVAGALMLVGLWLHLTERHVHDHEHMLLTHNHRHRHDIHHHHDHASGDPAGEPHSHAHAHARLRHSHRHFPDAHHAHGH